MMQGPGLVDRGPPLRAAVGPGVWFARLTGPVLTASLIQVEDTRGYLTLVLLVAVLAGLAAAVNRLSGLGHGRDDLVAAVRATVQLAAVGLVIAVVLQS
jgi:putative ABC transport system permease protein